MSEWKEYKLKDALEVKYGKDHKKLADGAIPVYGSGGIMRWVNQSIYNGESILIPRKGTLSNIMYVNKPFWSVDTMFYTKINRNLVVPKYLFYQLTEIDFANMNVGSAVPSMTVEILNDIDIILPPLPEQERIAEVLSSLDDKIDLLHRNNKTLEQLAETLFRQWFVEEADDSWEEVTLGMIAEIKAGGDKPKVFSEVKTNECSIPIYSNGIDHDGLYGYTDKPKINFESITVSARGTIGFICLRQEPYVPIVRLISIVPYENYLSTKYLYFWAKTQIISGTGTTQEQLTIPDFSNTNLNLPPFNKMKKFTVIVNNIFEKINSNKRQIETLKQIRDTLVPKLMSGIVRIKK
jgi:type I restriction enzyme S subunit